VRELKGLDDWAECLDATKSEPVFVFKHSTACPISWSAHERVLNFLDSNQGDCPEFYLVEVIEARPVSNAIAKDVSVHHKSPQLILVQDGKAMWSASHGRIREDAICEAINTFATAAKD